MVRVKQLRSRYSVQYVLESMDGVRSRLNFEVERVQAARGAGRSMMDKLSVSKRLRCLNFVQFAALVSLRWRSNI